MKAGMPLQHTLPKAAAVSTPGRAALNPLQQKKGLHYKTPDKTTNNPLQAATKSQNPLQLSALRAGGQTGNIPLQLRAQDSAVPQPVKENKTGLPDHIKAGVEQLSGINMDDVNVHYNSGQPAQYHALAYAQGTDIHIGPGQEKHLPHEAWHVVQQKQGRVQPTMQMKGAAINDDTVLEREADTMGRNAAAKGREFNSLTQSNNIIQAMQPAAKLAGVARASTRIIQRSVDVDFGSFKTSQGSPYSNEGQVGAIMSLDFQPSAFKLRQMPGITSIHLVQTIQDKFEDKAAYNQLKQGNLGFQQRLVPGGEHEGIGIDMENRAVSDPATKKIVEGRKAKLAVQVESLNAELKAAEEELVAKPQDASVAEKARQLKSKLTILTRQQAADDLKLNQINKVKGTDLKRTPLTSVDPRYAQQRLGEDVPVHASESLDQTSGWATVFNQNKWSPATARLRDNPNTPLNSPVTGMNFEVSALGEGNGQSRFLGSVSWGWERPKVGSSTVKFNDIKLSHKSAASSAFFAAAEHFNKLEFEDEAGATHKAMPLPLHQK